MNVKKIALAGAMIVLAIVLFTQVRRLGSPSQSLDTIPEPVIQQVEYGDVLVATMGIPVGTRLGPEHLSWKKWPKENISHDFINSEQSPQAIDELTGSIVRSDIYENEPINSHKIVDPDGRGPLATLISPGMRAVAARTTPDTAVAGFIRPGDRVDIILTSKFVTDPYSERTSMNNVSETIFANVKVLAVDNTYKTNPDGEESDMLPEDVGTSVTFEMTQSDAELFQQSIASGDLSLTLRPLEKSYGNSGKSAATVRKSTSKGRRPIVLYRGDQAQQVAVRGQ